MLAELFDVLVAGKSSNRAAFSAYISVVTSSTRTNLITATLPRALSSHLDLTDRIKNFVARVGNFNARRNELAHGMALNLGEYGHYLGPNNIMPRKWSSDGTAKFQYTSEDIKHYTREFQKLREECIELTEAVILTDVN
jgi:hypothetical protein